ncbi:hypothetical protein [Terrisporobacter glycolicus]|uniref:hypothetical protein n=1 Tax=Terrisporobacter glycolicus TaxID=36841 RepID=UPI0034639042
MIKKFLTFIVITFVFCITSCSNSSLSIENYLNSGTSIDSKAKDIMPELEDLSEYEDIKYKYTHKSVLIFESHSVALVVSYNDNTFESEKEKIDEQYTFLDKKIKSSFDESKYYIPEYEFSVDSYAFRVVDESDTSNTEFPKSFGMIGISEEKKSIAYLYFYDGDLDYIGDENEKNPMANFVRKYFKYNF